jgi:hypothetical protein
MSDIDTKERSHRTQENEGEPKLQGQHQPTNPWDAEIDVTLTSAGPPAQFEIATCLPIDASGNIVFNNAGRPGFRVKFRLYDNTNNGNGSGYAFPQGANKQDGVWSEVGSSGCPNAGVWQVFEQNSIVVQDNGATLVARNPNLAPAQGAFRYTLNVTTTGGPPYLPLDPGGDNQNGSSLKE